MIKKYLFATITFFTALLSMSSLMNGTCGRELLTKIDSVVRTTFHDVQTASLASVRDPAMMRVNPVVHGAKFRSPLEAAMFEKSKSDLSLGLSKRANDFSRGTDARTVNRVQELGLDFGMIIPSRLSPVSDVSGVSSQLLDHSVSAIFNNGIVKNSFVGRAAYTVEKKMKAEVALGGNDPDSTPHNIKFQVKASETKAVMEYRGLTNADLSYSIGGRKTRLEIYEKISDDSNLVYTHSDEPSDRRDVLSLRMHW